MLLLRTEEPALLLGPENQVIRLLYVFAFVVYRSIHPLLTLPALCPPFHARLLLSLLNVTALSSRTLL
jgi:hypothetical protein